MAAVFTAGLGVDLAAGFTTALGTGLTAFLAAGLATDFTAGLALAFETGLTGLAAAFTTGLETVLTDFLTGGLTTDLTAGLEGDLEAGFAKEGFFAADFGADFTAGFVTWAFLAAGLTDFAEPLVAGAFLTCTGGFLEAAFLAVDPFEGTGAVTFRFAFAGAGLDFVLAAMVIPFLIRGQGA